MNLLATDFAVFIIEYGEYVQGQRQIKNIQHKHIVTVTEKFLQIAEVKEEEISYLLIPVNEIKKIYVRSSR